MLSVAFDDREHTLYAAFTKRTTERTDIVVESRRLDMGDVLIQKTTTEQGTREGPVIIVERKQVHDTMNSLFDGRLAEQCSRMRQYQLEQSAGEVWIIVVVEGTASPEQFRGTNPDGKFRHIQGFLPTHSEQTPDGFVKTHLQLVLDAQPNEYRLVMRTTNEDETAALILTLHKTITAGVHCTHSAMVRSMPRKTRSDIFIRQLCCTQGISQQRAEQIRLHFPTLRDLHQAMQDASTDFLAKLSQAIGSQRIALRLCTDMGCAMEAPVVSKKRRKNVQEDPPQSSISSSSSTVTLATTSG